jgi:hypothetical protein
MHYAVPALLKRAGILKHYQNRLLATLASIDELPEQRA